MNKKLLTIVWAIGMLFLLSGCATDLRNVNRVYKFDTSNSKGIIFGKTSFEIPGALQYRIRFVNIEDGKNIGIGVRTT